MIIANLFEYTLKYDQKQLFEIKEIKNLKVINMMQNKLIVKREINLKQDFKRKLFKNFS